MIISKEDRVNFYYGDTEYQSIEPEIPRVVKHDVCFASHQDYSALKEGYVKDVNRYLSLRKTKTPLWFKCGDCFYSGNPAYPVFVKTRNPHKGVGVICNLNSPRHWTSVYEIFGSVIGGCILKKKYEINWNLKIGTPIWRGRPTGLKKKYSRGHFVEEYYSKYDVGFIQIPDNLKHLRKYNKAELSIEQMMKHKYIICIEGNDKSSAVNWVLASNSVPIMRKPLVHSWLCEPWLKPNVHYVEVKEDFSNLEEKVEWCRENDGLCREIAENGKKFMLENFKKETEKEIETLLVHKVQEKLNNSC